MKTRLASTTVAAIAVIVLLSSPTLVGAQPASHAVPGSRPESSAGQGAQIAPSQVYGKVLAGVEKEIVGAAEAMPAEKYNFAPTNGNFQGVRTFGQQVKHLASANFHYFGRLGVPPTTDPKSIDKLTTKEDIVKALKDSFSFAHQAVDTITSQNAFQSLDDHGNTRAGVATAALVHCNDHYGQMVEYLRMNGIIPPASRR